MNISTALASGILALSFSSLAAAAGADTDVRKGDAATHMDAGTSADVDAKTHVKKNRRNARAKAAGGASASANTGANGRDNSNASSPSQASGMPGHASQGSVHNDESKK
jgi:hypothetical protein